MVKTNNFQLRYANCWEDTEVLLQHINRGPGAHYLSIASGGENALALLCLDPARVHVVDINPLQIYLLELKMAAIRTLDHEDCKAFLGYQKAANRNEVYKKLSNQLSKEACTFWDSRSKKISKGIIYDGRVERNFKFFAKYIRPLIHNDKMCAELLRPKPLKDQISFYNNRWNTRKWRLIFKLFFSNTVLKLMAPDPDFFNYIDQDVSTYLLDKTSKMFQSKGAQNNHILQYALFGHFGHCLHYFTEKSNYEIIKSRLDRITLETGFFQNSIQRGEKFDGFNLSNIFEYTTPDEFKELRSHLEKGGKPQARYVYWNILVPRQLSEGSNLIELLADSSKDPTFEDRAWVYFRCLVENKK